MKTISAAFCDDDAVMRGHMRARAEESFARCGVTLRAEEFESPAAFLAAAGQGRFSLLFLDIDMPEMDGIDLGVRLRTMQEKIAIIYISNCEERVFDSFQARPFGFVRKSSFLKDIQSVATLYTESLRSENDRQLEVKTTQGLTKLPLSEIVYIECDKDYQFFHLNKKAEPLKCRLSMTKLEETLVDEGFLRIHQGYIVNYAYIKRIDNESLELLSGETIPMSRRKKQEVFTQYLRLSRSDKAVLFAQSP